MSHPTNTFDDSAEGPALQPTAHKKGYSIWSLLVIMTLLAVWLAVPRDCERASPKSAAVFFSLHQIVGWSLISTFLWIATGRKAILGAVLLAAIFVAWGPIVCGDFIEPLLGLELTEAALVKLGLLEWYRAFYRVLDKSFGYHVFG